MNEGDKVSNNMIFPKRKVLKKWVRFSLLGIIITLFISSLIIMLKSINKPDKNASIILYSYLIKQDMDYKVNLYDNSYIESNYLGKDETYISDLIKQIEMEYKYNFSGSKIIPLSYTYSIDAVINGKYNLDDEDSKVWTKKYNLVKPVTLKVDDKSSIDINRKVNIDFKYYNDVVSKFRQELKLPINASLNVVFTINVDGIVDNQKINDTKTMTLNIPLNQQAFKIKEEYQDVYSKNITPKIEKKEVFSARKLLCGILLGVVSIVLFITLFREIFNVPKKNVYTTKLNKILKEYGDIIVEVLNPVNETDMDIVEVKNFNEMVDLEEELRVPIMFYETIDYLEGEFTLLHNNILYKFTLKNE